MAGIAAATAERKVTGDRRDKLGIQTIMCYY